MRGGAHPDVVSLADSIMETVGSFVEVICPLYRRGNFFPYAKNYRTTLKCNMKRFNVGL